MNADRVHPEQLLRHPARMARLALKGVALCLVASSLLVFWKASPESWKAIDRFQGWMLVPMTGMIAMAWVFNAWRTMVLARSVGHRLRFMQALGITLSVEFTFSATPGGVGSLPTRLFMQKRAGISYTETMTMTSVDIGVDLILFTLLTPFALHWMGRHGLLDSLSERVSLTTLALTLGVPLVLVAGLASVGLNRRAIVVCFGWMRRTPGLGRLASRMVRLRARAQAGAVETWTLLRAFWRGHKTTFLITLMLAGLQFACRYGVLPMTLWAFGVHVNPFPLMVMQGALFLISLVVVLPGGGGAVELLAGVLLPMFAPAALAPLVVLIWRFFTYHLYLLAGGLMFFQAIHHLDRLAPHAPPAIQPGT